MSRDRTPTLLRGFHSPVRNNRWVGSGGREFVVDGEAGGTDLADVAERYLVALRDSCGESAALPRGRKGRVETDAYSFDFKPSYGGDTYVAFDQPFDSQALFALRRAKWLRIKVDGRLLVDATLENTGFAEILDSAAACSPRAARCSASSSSRPGSAR